MEKIYGVVYIRKDELMYIADLAITCEEAHKKMLKLFFQALWNLTNWYRIHFVAVNFIQPFENFKTNLI